MIAFSFSTFCKSLLSRKSTVPKLSFTKLFNHVLLSFKREEEKKSNQKLHLKNDKRLKRQFKYLINNKICVLPIEN